MHRSLMTCSLLLLVACDSTEPEHASVTVKPRVQHPQVRPPERTIPLTTPMDLARTVPSSDVRPAETAPESESVDAVATIESVANSAGGTEVSSSDSYTIEVKAGESLSDLARWSRLTAEDLAQENQIEVTATLMPGQDFRISILEEEVADFEKQREDSTNARLDRYLSSRGGLVGLQTHTVHTGELAWSLARDTAGVPLWVLAAFNPTSDLDRITIGQKLYFPQLSDTVAEADTEEFSLERELMGCGLDCEE